MSVVRVFLAVVIASCVGLSSASAAAPSTDDAPADKVVWHTDYARAMAEAERRDKMLFINFRDADNAQPCQRFETETLDAPGVRRKLQDYVCVRIPLDAKIKVQGKDVVLLQDESFREMLGKPGVAIVDFRSTEEPLRGAVVSTFPITDSLWYTPERMVVILDLPPGTLTQRTLIYAVRIHPDHPESTDGQELPLLEAEAAEHSQYQADVGVQGHQGWGSRFRKIVARLPGGLSAKEVCAESWPGQHLVESAIECVRCWRLSEGHWSAVVARHNYFGYDMRRGRNGVWYATGIFGGRQ